MFSYDEVIGFGEYGFNSNASLNRLTSSMAFALIFKTKFLACDTILPGMWINFLRNPLANLGLEGLSLIATQRKILCATIASNPKA